MVAINTCCPRLLVITVGSKEIFIDFLKSFISDKGNSPGNFTAEQVIK